MLMGTCMRNMTVTLITNNSAHFVRSKENKELPISDREAIGDATETAMLRYTQAYTDIDELRTQLPPAVEVPFNSDKKWSAGVYSKQHTNGVYTVYLKVSSTIALVAVLMMHAVLS
jgi:magnesium-transporting ATPase (P-type)